MKIKIKLLLFIFAILLIPNLAFAQLIDHGSGTGGSFPPAGCATANGVIFNNATPCDADFTYSGAGVAAGNPAVTIIHPYSGAVTDSALNLHSTADSAGRLLQFFYDGLSSTIPIAYFNDGAHYFSRSGITSSGVSSGANITPATTEPYMIGAYGDVNGPMFVSHLSSPVNVQARHIDFNSNDTITVFEGAILSHAVYAWGTSTSPNAWDTFLGRGNAAATLQLGGPDAFAPVAQNLAVQNAPASVTWAAAQGASGPAGQAVLASGVVFPSTIQVGMTITDTTTPTSIPANTTVLSFNAQHTSMTVSANFAGAGVIATDALAFSSINVAGVDLTIGGSQGTGTGAGGRIVFATAPAGSTGSAKNALINALFINPTLSSSLGAVSIDRGGNSIPQLTFIPNSGAVASIGMANGGTQLIFYNSTGAQQLGISGSIVVPGGSAFGWSSGGVVTGTVNPRISGTSGGSITMDTTATGNGLAPVSLGTLIVTSIASDATHTDTTVCQDTTTHLLLAGSGTAGICLGNISSIRFKRDWTDITDGLGVMRALDPGTYRYNEGIDDGGKQLRVGFTAERYAQVLPNFTRFDSENRPNGLDMLAAFPYAVRAIQQLDGETVALRADNDNLRADIEALRKSIPNCGGTC